MNDDESEGSDLENDQAFVLIANEILRKCKINGEVQNLKECADSFFIAIYEGILGEALEGIVTNALSREQRISNCDKVIDALSHDVLNVDLSHITGKSIIDEDVTTVQNLLEIFKELLDFILYVDDEFDLEDVDEQNDSNQLSSDHEVISDVLQEELGHAAYDAKPPVRNTEVSSSIGSVIVEPELSSIAKCSEVLPYSRNSDVDSNSTDEIITESELLERQLTRDYPSLRELKNREGHAEVRIRESEKDLESLGHKKKLSEDKNGRMTQCLPTTSGLGNLKRFERKLEQEERKIDKVNIVGEVKNDLRSNGCRKTGERSVKLRHSDLSKTGRRLDHHDGISERVDDVHKGNLGDFSRRKTGRPGITSKAVDSVPGLDGGTIRDTELPRSRRTLDGRTEEAGNVYMLDNATRKPVTIPTGLAGEMYTAKDSGGFAVRDGTSRDVGGTIKGQEAKEYRNYLTDRINGEQHLKDIPGLEDSRNRPLTSIRNNKPHTAAINREDLSVHTRGDKTQTELIKKPGLLSQKGTGISSFGLKRIEGKHSERINLRSEQGLKTFEPKKDASKTAGSCLSTATTSFKESSRFSGKHADPKENKTRKGSKWVEKTVKTKSRWNTLGLGGVSKGESVSLEDSNGGDGSKKGKESKRSRGVIGGGERSKVERKDAKDRREEQGTTKDVFFRRRLMEYKEGGRKEDGMVRSEVTDEQKRTATYRDGDSFLERSEATQGSKERMDSSDTSGVFWDDQISPLDASEVLRNPGQGLAFDEVGLSKKSTTYDTRQGLGKSKDTRDSPVIRHYHHHFHHGSSEDLVRDVGLSEKAERLEKQVAESRGKPGLKSSFSRSDHWDLGEESRKTRKKKEGATNNDDRRSQRSVKFDDHVDTLLITNRLERLRREMDEEDDEQNQRRSQIKNGYHGYLGRLNKEHRRMEKELKQVPKKTRKSSPYNNWCGVSHASRGRGHEAYSKPTNQRRARYRSTKARKRSTSTSPKLRQRRKAAKQLEKGDIILPTLIDEFPYLHLSPHTLQTMRRKQTEQLLSLSKSAQVDKQQTKTQKVIEDAEKRQQTLLKILRKDLQHNHRMREQKERKEQERAIKSKLREKRHASARARRYYEDYQLRMRARILKRRTREEQIFKNLYEDGLEIQKQRVRELRSYAKEQREMRAVRQQNELESLENYYRDQYSILAEAIAQEKEALLVREKAQEKVIHQMQRNLRQKLEKEVTDIQETLVRDEDDAYFRRLDADRLRRQLQMTAFQNLS